MKKRGQVWIETAIYTLIGLTIIGIVLSIATPQIEKAKERGIITQTHEALNLLNAEIQKVELAEGSVKIIDFRISKGKLDIVANGATKDIIKYTLENSKLEFSEEGERIKEGDVFFMTEKIGRRYNVILELEFDNLDIKFEGDDKLKTLQGATTPYKIRIENLGSNNVDNKIEIDVSIL